MAKSAQTTVLLDPTEIRKGELGKSSKTRTRIMEAAIASLAEDGYAGTTTTSVAQRADMTRAAMLYHFKSRMALIEAVIHYVTRARIDSYTQIMHDLPRDDDFFLKAMDYAWEMNQTPAFHAFTELSVAARTDRELGEVFEPALLEYDRARREAALQLFPPDHLHTPNFDLRRDIVRFLLEGLALQSNLAFDAEERKTNIISFLKALATEPEGRTLLDKARRIAGND